MDEEEQKRQAAAAAFQQTAEQKPEWFQRYSTWSKTATPEDIAIAKQYADQNDRLSRRKPGTSWRMITSDRTYMDQAGVGQKLWDDRRAKAREAARLESGWTDSGDIDSMMSDTERAKYGAPVHSSDQDLAEMQAARYANESNLNIAGLGWDMNGRAGSTYDRPNVPFAAASAFEQLDGAGLAGPLEYDPATAAGLPQDTQEEFRRNWDDNLTAARRAVEAANGPSKEDRDALAIYTDHLVQMADDYQAQRQRPPQTEMNRIKPPDMAQARTMSAPAQQQFVPLVTDDDYLAAAKRSQAEKYGEDPFDFL